MTDAELTGYCGLYCGDCVRYMSRSSVLAKELLKEFEETQFAEYARVKQSQIPDFEHFNLLVRLLKHISQLRCEMPCRMGGDGCGGTCNIIKCIKDKSLEGCWECSEHERCEKRSFLKPFHGDTPLENFGKIKKFGIKSWAKHRGKFYPWLTISR